MQGSINQHQLHAQKQLRSACYILNDPSDTSSPCMHEYRSILTHSCQPVRKASAKLGLFRAPSQVTKRFASQRNPAKQCPNLPNRTSLMGVPMISIKLCTARPSLVWPEVLAFWSPLASRWPARKSVQGKAVCSTIAHWVIRIKWLILTVILSSLVKVDT